MRVGLIFLFSFLIQIMGQAQKLPVGFPIIEEKSRRDQIIQSDSSELTFRPRNIILESKETKYLVLMPSIVTSQFNSNRPYGWGDYGMIPNKGLQQAFSVGFVAKYKFINVQIYPEFVWATNSSYKGFSNEFSDNLKLDWFRFLNFNDFPERFGDKTYSNLWLGQSKVSFEFGAFELGASTQNLWWGPGQFNSLTFSNNSQGFPHLTFNTSKPAKTFIGNFEGQIIVGRLENSNIAPTQFSEMNERFFRPFTGDWRYLNGMTLSFNPIWVSGLFVGFSRTFQQYNELRGNQFRDYFPIFEAFQKKEVGFDKDGEGKDQQATLFARYVLEKANFEFYFEYGRRDHAFNWREAILNPEHARAYILGFVKLIESRHPDKFVQIRGEVTHQQESINRYIRYPGLVGGASWHTHDLARGFVQNGQPLGVGIGTGSNIQIFEVSVVENFNKIGVLLERLENHQDFYYRAFGQQEEHKPWIDLSIGFLFDKQWDNLLLRSKLQLINGINYQWQLNPKSTPDFPKGENLFSVHSQVSLIYLFHK